MIFRMTPEQRSTVAAVQNSPRPLDPKCPFCREVLIQPTTLVKVHCPGCDNTFKLVVDEGERMEPA